MNADLVLHLERIIILLKRAGSYNAHGRNLYIRNKKKKKYTLSKLFVTRQHKEIVQL